MLAHVAVCFVKLINSLIHSDIHSVNQSFIYSIGLHHVLSKNCDLYTVYESITFIYL